MREPVPTGLSAPDVEKSDRLVVAAAKQGAAAQAAKPKKTYNSQSASGVNPKPVKDPPPPPAITPEGFPATWSTIQWNPPVHRATSGAFVDYDGGTGGTASRASVLGNNSIRDRRALKGVIYQHIAHPDEWEITDENIQNLQDIGAGTYSKDAGRPKNVRYGFRFHYNPSTIDFGLALSNDGLNPALIISGMAKSMPITSPEGSPTIRVQFFLNRMEDMTLLARNAIPAKQMAAYRDARDVWEASAGVKGSVRPTRPIPEREVTEEQLKYFYGRNLLQEEIDGIYERGTGYDLEFLFRSILGRPWPTLLRGNTADVGIAFGMPMILDLSVQQDPGGGVTGTGGNRYLGRLNSVSYSHLSFDHRMVPIWTQCAMDFLRYPDAKPDPVALAVGGFKGAVQGIANFAAAATDAEGIFGRTRWDGPLDGGDFAPGRTPGGGDFGPDGID